MKTDVVDNIKQLVKSLYQLASKSSTGLTIKSMHDSAQVISKMHGFGSWNELKQNLEYLKKDYVPAPVEFAKVPQFEDIKIKKQDSYIPLNNPSKVNEPVELLEKNLLQDIMVGRNYNAQLKSSTFLSLEPEDFMIVSSVDNTSIIKNIKNQIKEFGNSYIHLTDTSNIKLDPWTYIFEQNGVELMFHLKEHKNDFIMSWISTFRYLHHEINFHPTIKEAIDYLSLPGIVGVYDWIKLNKPNAAWYLERYLDSIGIIENKNEYFISSKVQEKHWDNIKAEVYILESLAQLYKAKVFQPQEKDTLWQSFSQRKNIKIGISQILPNIYKEFVTIELSRIAEQYDKLIAHKLTENYKIWLFCDSLEEWETNSLLSLQERDCLIRGYITSGKSKNLNSFLIKSEQILLGKILNIDLPNDVMGKMLNKTQTWEENIWFDDKKILKNLKPGEVFFWHAKKDLNRIKELRDFICEKCICDL